MSDAEDREEVTSEPEPAPAQTGRPTKYQKEYAEKALELCKSGATIREVAEFFQVSEKTVRNWSHEYPEFFTALKTGREAADIRVEQALYRRATGYSHDSVKILQEKGQPVIVPYVEHYPPDTVAAIFWLKNRRPSEWRDVKAVEHSGEITQRHAIELSDDELARIATGSGKGVANAANSKAKPSGVH